MHYDLEILETKTRESTLKINNYFIHSKYDPIKEANQLADRLYKPHQAHILFGYGCGHLLRAIAKVRKFDEIIILIEPLLEHEKIKIENIPSNTLIFGKDVLENFEFFLGEFTADYRVSYNVICLANYDKLFVSEYKLLLSKVKDVQMKNQVNDYTSIYFSKMWQKNFIENIFHLSKDHSLNVLENAYNHPVVIASGGPSLNKQLTILKENREKMILIAAGSTINSLLKEGIEPDYVVSIDGGVPNYNHFKNLNLESAKIIYTMQSHPGVRKAFRNKGYVVDLKGHPLLSKYMKEQLNVNLPLFEGGGTVAHIAFSIAQYISSGPIALIGQDLAYTNNITHATANLHTKEINDQYLKQKNAFKTLGFDDKEVWTSPVFYSMKLEFEDLIKINYPKNKFFNCTEGGLVLNGYEQLGFKEFCVTYLHEQITIIPPTSKKEHSFKAINFLKKEIKLYDELQSILLTAIGTVKSNPSNTIFTQGVLKKLDKLDANIHDIIYKLPIESLLSPITLKVMKNYLPKLNETKDEEFLRVKNQSMDFYKHLIEATKLAKQYTTEIIDKYVDNEETSDE